MSISQQSIDDIRARADIVSEIGSRVALKRSGDNFIGLCPFHAEKSASFSVSLSKQFFHCFGCGKSGDVFRFLMEHDGMQFHEAVRDLGERMGIKIEEDQSTQEIEQARLKRKAVASLEDLCETAASFYQGELKRSAKATAYTAHRGLSDEVMDTYGIGYAPDPDSRKALSSAFSNYFDPRLVDAGLVGTLEREGGYIERYDRFRGRLIFPIRNVRGRCIGFGGRVLGDAKPKYLNSPETEIFLKHKVLYGLHEARAHISTSKQAFVTEGYMDVVGMAQYGIGNAVAALGTSLCEDHMRILLRFTDRVCFVFDGDAPGKKAAQRALKVVLPLLEPKHSFSFLTLPNGQDPDEYLRDQGKESFLAAAKAAPTLSQYLMSLLLNEFGQDGRLTSAEAKTQFGLAAKEHLELINPTNPLRELIEQDVDKAMGRVPRAAATNPAPVQPLSLDQRVAAAALRTAQAWIPRDEWIKAKKEAEAAAVAAGIAPRFSGYSGKFSQPAPIPLTLEKKTLWDHLINAVVIAPQEATAAAISIIEMLDLESEDEMPLILLLTQYINSKMPSRNHLYPPDTLQSAIDLINNAERLIKKQRILDVRSELTNMHATGRISEEEYIVKMMNFV